MIIMNAAYNGVNINFAIKPTSTHSNVDEDETSGQTGKSGRR